MRTEIQAGSPVFTKQLTVKIPGDDWKLLRLVAARRHVPLTDVLMGLIKPGIDELRAMPDALDDDD